jgi:hypothetical protein
VMRRTPRITVSAAAPRTATTTAAAMAPVAEARRDGSPGRGFVPAPGPGAADP